MIWKTAQDSQINTRSSHPEVLCQKMLIRILQNLQKKCLCWSLFFNKVVGWKTELSEVATGDALWKEVFLKKRALVFQNYPFIDPLHKIDVFEQFTKFTGKSQCWSVFLFKLQFWGTATLLRKTPTQKLSSEIPKIFNNNYFEEHLQTSTSKPYLKIDSNTGVFLWILWIIQEQLFCKGSTNDLFRNTCAEVSL